MNETGDADGSSRGALAEQLLASGLDASLAERAARSALRTGETMRPTDHLLMSLPKEVIERSLRMWNYPVYRSSLGWSLATQDRIREALTELRQAAKFVDERHLRAQRVFFRLGQVLERANEPQQALDAYVMEIASGGDTVQARRAIAQLPNTVQAARAVLPQRVNDASTMWATADSNRQEVEEVDEALGRFELTSPDGKPFRIDSIKGKAAIIDFWASWCISCRPSMASSERLRHEFPEDLVIIAPAGDPLETQDKAAKFLAGHNYRFIHLVDDPAQRALPTPWIPARVAIDRAGRVRIKESGATEAGIAQFETKVRAMLSH